MQPRERYHDVMAQLSLRIDDALHRRARQAADAAGVSLNSYIGRVLSVAVDPSADEPDADRIRARLAAAGVIDSPVPPPPPDHSSSDEQRFQDALARSGGGTPGSALIEQERAAGW